MKEVNVPTLTPNKLTVELSLDEPIVIKLTIIGKDRLSVLVRVDELNKTIKEVTDELAKENR